MPGAQLTFDVLARDRASKVFDQIGARADKTNANFAKVGTGMSGMLGRIGTAVGGLALGWQAWDKIMVGGFTRLANLDDARKRLDQMGISTSDAAMLMDGLKSTVEGTAFSLDAGAGAMTGFVTAGVDLDEVNDRLQMTADTAAFAQQPLDDIALIFQKIQTQGKLTAEEVNMLAERGVPALALLADAAGVTGEAMREMISRGEIDAERFFQLWEQGSKGFGENNIKIEGAAKSMGDTIRGSLENAETALARLGAELLDDFTPAIKEGADAFKEFGTVAVEALDEIDQFTKETGLQAFTDKAKEANRTGADFFRALKKSYDESNEVIESFFKEVFGVENVSAMTLMADATDDATGSTKLFSSAMDGAKSVARDFAGIIDETAAKTETAATAFSEYQDALKASTDPVFALVNAVDKVGESQAAYNEAVATYGANSSQAQEAAVGLFEATVGLDSAAHNADLSFAGVNEVLDQMVSQGALTVEQAELIAGAVDEARGAAEDYQGPYTADLLAEIDDPAIRDAKRQLDAVARSRNPRYLAELDRQAEIRARNKLNAVAAPRRSSITASANTSRAESAINYAARTRFATINVGYAVTGSGLPRGLQHGGPAEAHRPYIVGEAGPELFIPDQSGRILTNRETKSLTGGGSSLSGGTSHTTVQLINQGVIGSQREVERWLSESVNKLRRTGRLN